VSLLDSLKRRDSRPGPPPAGRPRKGRPRPVEFVVFCDARTGSYNLVSRLNSCADVVCHGEIFKKNRIEVSDFHRRKLSVKDTATRDAAPMAFIAELRALNPARHFGFKIFSGHLGWAPDAVDYLTAPGTRRILLMRPPLEIYASRLRAQETGAWTLPTRRDPAKAPPKTAVRFTAESFEAFAQHYNRHVATARMLAALPGSFVIHYGQTSDPAAMDALLGFVGSAGRFADTSSEYRKQYDGSLREAFANWDELEATLPGLPPLAAMPAPTHAPFQPAESPA
jgi:hypothetical protein